MFTNKRIISIRKTLFLACTTCLLLLSSCSREYGPQVLSESENEALLSGIAAAILDNPRPRTDTKPDGVYHACVSRLNVKMLCPTCYETTIYENDNQRIYNQLTRHRTSALPMLERLNATGEPWKLAFSYDYTTLCSKCNWKNSHTHPCYTLVVTYINDPAKQPVRTALIPSYSVASNLATFLTYLKHHELNLQDFATGATNIDRKKSKAISTANQRFKNELPRIKAILGI